MTYRLSKIFMRKKEKNINQNGLLERELDITVNKIDDGL